MNPILPDHESERNCDSPEFDPEFLGPDDEPFDVRDPVPDELPEFDLPDPAASGTSDLEVFSAEIRSAFLGRELELIPIREIVGTVTEMLLDAIDPDDPPSPARIEQVLLETTTNLVAGQNALRKGLGQGALLTTPKELDLEQIARILQRLHHIVRITPSARNTEPEYDLLAVYRPDGEGSGTYSTSEEHLRSMARRYGRISLRDFAEVVAVLREEAPRLTTVEHPDLITAANGIVFYGAEDETIMIGGKRFDFRAKGLHPFDPAIVLTTKSRVDYVEDAPAVRIPHPDGSGDWEVGEWIADLFDQPGQEGLADLVWEVMGAIVRPRVRWDKTTWFHSTVGSNAKGTLCALMRNLVGDGAHASIPIKDFGREFLLEPLVRATAVIVDENDVGLHIEEAGNYKAVATNDVVQINRKNRVPIAFQFRGHMVQCVNDLPTFKDKSGSLYRRQLIIPFTKTFQGAERKYIKGDYLQRREVLEYVLWYVVNRAGTTTPGNYYELAKPPGHRAHARRVPGGERSRAGLLERVPRRVRLGPPTLRLPL